MIATLMGIESALLVAMASCRKRAAVLRSLAAKRPDSAGIRALTRSIASLAPDAGRAGSNKSEPCNCPRR